VDIDDTPQEARYRAEVRSVLHADPRNPQEIARYKQTQRVLHDGGLVGATWPIEYGGRGLSSMHQVIINQELSAVGVPPLVGQIGLGMCGPTLMTHGTDAQKRRHLARLLDGSDIWSQLFSEPGAGSDLAGISTRAVKVEGGWLLNGQKVWTSLQRLGHHPDAHRPDGSQAPRAHDAHPGPPSSRGHDSPPAPDERRERLQRDLPR
jgi:alkylation response protein AidB-like acyl-CoA dehydrogenase